MKPLVGDGQQPYPRCDSLSSLERETQNGRADRMNAQVQVRQQPKARAAQLLKGLVDQVEQHECGVLLHSMEGRDYLGDQLLVALHY